MEKITGSEPVYPTNEKHPIMEPHVYNKGLTNEFKGERMIGYEFEKSRGLTIRQHFADIFTAATMTGIITASGENAHGWSAEDFAKSGVSQADALIAELNKPISSNTIKQE